MEIILPRCLSRYQLILLFLSQYQERVEKGDHFLYIKCLFFLKNLAENHKLDIQNLSNPSKSRYLKIEMLGGRINSHNNTQVLFVVIIFSATKKEWWHYVYSSTGYW